MRDDYDPDWHYASSYDGPPRDLTKRQPYGALTSHDLMMAEYLAAAEQWERGREATALGYAAEEEIYASEHRRPRLEDFMPEQARYAADVASARLPGYQRPPRVRRTERRAVSGLLARRPELRSVSPLADVLDMAVRAA